MALSKGYPYILWTGNLRGRMEDVGGCTIYNHVSMLIEPRPGLYSIFVYKNVQQLVTLSIALSGNYLVL